MAPLLCPLTSTPSTPRIPPFQKPLTVTPRSRTMKPLASNDSCGLDPDPIHVNAFEWVVDMIEPMMPSAQNTGEWSGEFLDNLQGQCGPLTLRTVILENVPPPNTGIRTTFLTIISCELHKAQDTARLASDRNRSDGAGLGLVTLSEGFGHSVLSTCLRTLPKTKSPTDDVDTSGTPDCTAPSLLGCPTDK